MSNDLKDALLKLNWAMVGDSPEDSEWMTSTLITLATTEMVKQGGQIFLSTKDLEKIGAMMEDQRILVSIEVAKQGDSEGLLFTVRSVTGSSKVN